jgi:ABC-2 type transport system permease protein
VLPSVLGGAAGLAPLASLVSVQPLDETGNPTPAWSLKVHIALLAVALTTLVPAMILLAAWLGQTSWLSWAAVPAGIATGVSLAAYLGRRAVIRLESQQVRILTILADAAR